MTDPEPIESLTSPPIVGRFYVVPCLLLRVFREAKEARRWRESQREQARLRREP